MKFRSATLLVAIAVAIEIIRYIGINFILSNVVENWWEIDAVTYLNQGIYIFFLISLLIFFVTLFQNQKQGTNE